LNNARNLSYSYPYLKLAKTLFLSYYCYVFSSANWRRGQNRFCLKARGVRGEGGSGEAGGRDGSNNVCTYEYMNKKIFSLTVKKKCPLSSNVYANAIHHSVIIFDYESLRHHLVM
jgi:hypothetical protein